MSYSFNPFNGSLERVNHLDFKKIYKEVDAQLILTREIELGFTPLENSEMFFINGLILKDDCYIISSTTLIIDSGLDIRIGDEIDIRYAN